MNYVMAAKIMMTGKDPRIDALERARELCRASFSSGWEIRIKASDELSGHHVYFRHNDETRPYSIYSEQMVWSCYYKNDKFMFAYVNYLNSTNIIGDFYRASDGDIYKGYDRIAVIPDEIGFTLNNSYSDSPAYGRYFSLFFNMPEIYHYYNQDGSIQSEGENLHAVSWSTLPIGNATMTMWGGLVVARSDYQTYINDVLDFCSN